MLHARTVIYDYKAHDECAIKQDGTRIARFEMYNGLHLIVSGSVLLSQMDGASTWRASMTSHYIQFQTLTTISYEQTCERQDDYNQRPPSQ
jgi:hypothetical protein